MQAANAPAAQAAAAPAAAAEGEAAAAGAEGDGAAAGGAAGARAAGPSASDGPPSFGTRQLLTKMPLALALQVTAGCGVLQGWWWVVVGRGWPGRAMLNLLERDLTSAPLPLPHSP